MGYDLWDRADQVLEAALDAPPAERDALLDRECAGDLELRALVERLLKRIGEDGSWLAPGGALDDPAWEKTAHSDTADLRVTMGNYRLLQRVGEGGMGEVWEAEQLQPVRRRVAIKLIKPGMDSKEVVARFESERQALALMGHANIAKVYEAGFTDHRRSYFAMEFVSGIPITEYCDLHRLDMPARLQLFLQVCSGVQHAHRRAIIHRDLKPSNILVAVEDDEPVPKIIDFGVAKAMSQPLTDNTLYTAMGQVIGTPAYMSPEQADLSGRGVDTRTDVYSLGAVLYELLVGARPLITRSADTPFDEVLRTIREVEPERPSSRLRSLSREDADREAKRRRLDTAHLHGHLGGDLDWITMKALEKERNRRYDSPAELAEDIRRHLRNEPVLAGPPTAGYRIGKFVRRHTFAVAAGVIFFLLLLGFAVSMAILAGQIAQQRDRANEQAATAAEVSDFLERLFHISEAGEKRGMSVTARELLDQGSERVEVDLADQPGVQVRLMQTMGRAYRGLGLYDSARPLLEESLVVLERDPDVDPFQLADAYENVADLDRLQGHYADGLKRAQKALELRENASAPDRLAVAEALRTLGLLQWRMGDSREALANLERSLRVHEEVLGPEHLDLATVLNNLGIVHWQLEELELAREYIERAIAIWEAEKGENHAEIAGALNNLAILFLKTDPERAREIYEQSLAIREDALGLEHPDVAESLNNLGNHLRTLGRHDESRAALERALAIREKFLPPDHPELGSTVFNIGLLLLVESRYEEALPYFERSRAIFEESLGTGHLDTAYAYHRLGNVHKELGAYDTSRRFYRQAVEVREAELGAQHSLVTWTLGHWVALERAAGDEAAAVALEDRIEAANAQDPES